MTRPGPRGYPRSNANTKFLLNAGPISFHCSFCGQPRYEIPTDVGTPRDIVLACAECTGAVTPSRHFPAEEHAPGCNGLCADRPGSEQCFA